MMRSRPNLLLQGTSCKFLCAGPLLGTVMYQSSGNCLSSALLSLVYATMLTQCEKPATNSHSGHLRTQASCFGALRLCISLDLPINYFISFSTCLHTKALPR